jgi:NAD(P)-dependent dehydrogenase (short-subunit alcohol dehydrogenase family)
VDFTGRTALVTGGPRGLGQVIALRLAGAGARVYAGSLHRDAAAPQLTPLRFDVTDAAACEAVVERITGEAGAFDIVVHAAGIARDSLFALSTPDDWDEALRVNLGGALRVVRAAIRPMIAAKLSAWAAGCHVARRRRTRRLVPRCPAVKTALAAHTQALRAATSSSDPIVQAPAVSALEKMGERPPAESMLRASNSAIRRRGIAQALAGLQA